ncbi:hypothetical protein [Uliginosibacterium sp. TH139]|uniref:hypothetical protein n=1 Tax=Uliginosibacterium sp. TH139 TaxID=2067453 RepID=UPI000C7CE431|nr:hypothetical protein [Uliginosibacterium sp. TH139]PLK48220.1 hypothetical protein C0V76_13395 [Uliginosibacterium sp. TH139]
MNALNLSAQASGLPQAGRCQRREAQPDWRAVLPKQWASSVLAPRAFERFRDYEILSERVLGYLCEGDESPCYCEHYFVLTDLRSDDDENYYLAPSYGEHLVAWQMKDGRWLIHRRITHGEACQSQAFFSFADEMPR